MSISPVDGAVGALHRPLRSLVRDELRRLVVTGELPPGARMGEEALAARLGVSRNPVREALQALAGEGFVEIVPRRGAFVAQISAAQAEELFAVRLALEPLAARLAARHADEADLAGLRDVLDQARASAEAGDLDRLTWLNTEFHSLVVATGRNDYLALLVAPMARRVQCVFRASAPTRTAHSWREHEELLQAVADHDEQAAEASAAVHVTAARASYRRLRATSAPVAGASPREG